MTVGWVKLGKCMVCRRKPLLLSRHPLKVRYDLPRATTPGWHIDLHVPPPLVAVSLDRKPDDPVRQILSASRNLRRFNSGHGIPFVGGR